MTYSSEKKPIDRRWRNRVFAAWVVASMIVALYIGVVGPFVTLFGEGWPFVALALPALMFFMVAAGLGWLVLIGISRRRTESGE